ncbi:MAG: 4-alpha-glucanotransferase [Cyclobacteriaceae bacterium]
MYLNFHIEYHTQWGQNLYVCGNIPELGSGDILQAKPMRFNPGGKWHLQLLLAQESAIEMEYFYVLKDQVNHVQIAEWGSPRKLQVSKKRFQELILHDEWRAGKQTENVLFSAAFTRNLMAPHARRFGVKTPKKYNLKIQAFVPRVPPGCCLCVLGDHSILGKWNTTRPMLMQTSAFPLWHVELELESGACVLQYKYGIYDLKAQQLVAMEDGKNRKIELNEQFGQAALVIKTDVNYQHSDLPWRGAGVAIPVFSLRSKKSWGIGEFSDLKLLIDWAKLTGLKLVQILPINDTVATHRWLDSYPYAAISVFALHPIYLHLPSMGKLKDKDEMKKYEKAGKKLNEKSEVDYEEVMRLKSKYYKKLYDETKDDFLSNLEFRKFFKQNKDWLVPYAAFSCLRDRYKTPEFGSWAKYSNFDADAIDNFVSPDASHFDDIAVHYFIQYHLHMQLTEVAEYARSKGVVLKGDIPIGIYRHSVDAWVAPQLYHMDKQAGAPPDAYAIAGQNWRFPTYNWQEMAKDNYLWWRNRLKKMSEYFDAYRIDHVLGFFRIWEIPSESVEGLMGRFNPAVPMYLDEMRHMGLVLDTDRMSKPFIKEYMLAEIFGTYKDEVEKTCLTRLNGDFYELKEAFASQRQVEAYFAEQPDDSKAVLEKKKQITYGLYALIGNVLFFEEPGSSGQSWHPKFGLHHTYSYKHLDTQQQAALNQIYIHYFYHRQETHWRQKAMEKLPAITSATDMMVCGEDLGMVPASVPDVMSELGMLSLNIQRMPKGTNAEFGHPANYEYLSVCSPSCHDMSTIRGWWEEDRARSQRFYEQILGHRGDIPYFCEPWLCREINLQHLYSPAMWAIFPIQDIVAMDEKLRSEKTHEEQINVPSNPQHFWRYRFHLHLEDLLKEDAFNRMLLDMVNLSGRNK